MTAEEKQTVDVAKNFVKRILGSNINIETTAIIFNIDDDKNLLLEHLEAIDSIISDAIYILKKEE